jgi:hypothetical protein
MHHAVHHLTGRGPDQGVPGPGFPTNSGDLVHLAWFAARVLPDKAVSAAAYTEGRVQDPA